MDKKGRPSVVPLILFLFFLQTIAPWLATECQAETGQWIGARGVIIRELLPYPRPGGLETEYVTIFNTGTSNVNITDWRICSKRQCAVIPREFGEYRYKGMIWAGMALTFIEDSTIFHAMKQGGYYDPFFAFKGMNDTSVGGDRYRLYAWPSMNNGGDYLLLEDANGTVIDTVAFGQSYQGPGWIGDPGPAPRPGWTMMREFRLDDTAISWLGPDMAFRDTNTSGDWPVYRTRRAEKPLGKDQSGGASRNVIAMRFPEDGDVLAWVLKNTTRELLVNTYEFTSMSMANILSDLAWNGVDVKVLVEGHPVGGMTDGEIQVLRALLDSGCMVRLAGWNSTESQPRPFALDHAKYMIIDGSRLVVMSENLVPSALGTSNTTGNRGWGMAIYAPAMAASVNHDVFHQDWRAATDARPVLPASNLANGTTLHSDDRQLAPRRPGKEINFTSLADFTLLVTPDYTEDHLLSIINGTKDRLYIEQLSCDLNWHLQSGVTEMQRSPLLDAVVAAARRGVEVKVLLDSNFLDTSDNDEVVAYLNEVANAEGLRLEARLADIPNITWIHNKGMVADDLVLVSSINWVDSAVRDNREVGVAIRMKGLDDLYVSYFMKDWEPQTQPPDDGPGPTHATGQSPVLPICGSLLAFGAITLALAVLMRRGRHEQP